MFLDFFYRLRARGVPVTTHTWLALVEALAKGLHQDTLNGFYQVARCILIQSEAHYDDFDRVFAESFRGVAADARDLLSQIEEWLRDPKLLGGGPGREQVIVGLGGQDRRFGLLELRLQRAGIELDEDIARLDHLALVRANLRNAAAQLGGDVDLARFDCSGRDQGLAGGHAAVDGLQGRIARDTERDHRSGNE